MIKFAGCTNLFPIFIIWYDSSSTCRPDNHMIPFPLTFFCPKSEIEITLETKEQEKKRIQSTIEANILALFTAQAPIQDQAPNWEII